MSGIRIDAMHLENLLRDIQPDSCNLHLDSPCSVIERTTVFQSGTTDAVRAGGVHVISRPSRDTRACNRGVSVRFPASAPTITSSNWRRIPAAIAESGDVESPSIPQTYRWLRRRDRWSDPVFYIETMVASRRIQDPAYFCTKTLLVFGAEIYRKSTGVLDLGKSSGKELPTAWVLHCP